MARDGLELQADPEVLRQLRESPAAAAVLVPVLYEALRIATLLGARAQRPRA